MFNLLFLLFESAWQLTNGLNYFRFWLGIRGFIRILDLKTDLPGPGEIDSPGYDDTPGRYTRQGIIPRGD